MKVSSTAVFHFVMTGEKMLETNLVLMQNIQADFDAPPFQRPSSTARPHRRPIQANASPAMSPCVGPRARTQAIGIVLGRRLRGDVVRVR